MAHCKDQYGEAKPSETVIALVADGENVTLATKGGDGGEGGHRAINGQNKTAVCTVRTTEAWGALTILAYSYGPLADPTGDRATCASPGGTYTPL
ncbi:MAG: hypothetical protein SFX73_26260 [Kofleriaceae bacterium]|nr:hypothetical protein [Kofleriaceae bacterium]